MIGVFQAASDGKIEFKPRLQPNQTDKVITTYMEIYGTPPPGQPLAVTFELADTPDAAARSSRKATIEGSSDPDRFVANSQLPIDALAPGDYVVRAIVTIAGKEVGRTVRIARRPAP